MTTENRMTNAFKIGRALGLAKAILCYSTDDLERKQLAELIETIDTIEL